MFAKHLAIVTLATTLAGCGQMGALYMPDDPNPPVRTEKPQDDTP